MGKRKGVDVDDDKMKKDSEYVVERICNKRIRRGKVEYFLKWKGYSESENTWEREEHLNCPAKIKAFEDSLMKTHSGKVDGINFAGTSTSVKRKPFMLPDVGRHNKKIKNDNDSNNACNDSTGGNSKNDDIAGKHNTNIGKSNTVESGVPNSIVRKNNATNSEGKNINGGLEQTASAPNYVQSTPINAQDALSNTQSALNNVQGTFNNVQGTLSKVQGTLNNVQGISSKVQGTSNNVQGISSKVQGTSNNVQRGTSSKVQGTLNNVQGTSSKVQGTSSKVQGTLNNVQRGTLSKVQGTSNNVQGALNNMKVYLEPDKIVGATDGPGRLMLFVKFVGRPNLQLVPYAEARNRWPQKLIDFFEEHVQFNDN